MKKTILTSLLMTAFSLPSIAAEPAKPVAAPTTAPAVQPAVAPVVDAKKQDHTVASHNEKKIKEVEDLFAKSTEEAKTLTDPVAKANAELALGHAKLELDAAKNETLKSQQTQHLRKARTFSKGVHGKHHKK